MQIFDLELKNQPTYLSSFNHQSGTRAWKSQCLVSLIKAIKTITLIVVTSTIISWLEKYIRVKFRSSSSYHAKPQIKKKKNDKSGVSTIENHIKAQHAMHSRIHTRLAFFLFTYSTLNKNKKITNILLPNAYASCKKPIHFM